ncbi:MAG: SIMPL domain-containing protein [Actinomycetota bacterium]
MNLEKNNNWLNAGLFLALGLVISSTILGWSYTSKKSGDESVTVTGSARKRIKSDLVVWRAGFSSQSVKLADAYSQLSANVPRIKQYLMSKGIAENQMTVSAIASTTLHPRDTNGNETSEITGYSLQQEIEVRSNDVDRIAQIAREATELINQGILLESSPPKYFYTALGDLKVEMLGEAAKDAKTRAEKIAASTGNKIGSLRSAKMGVMQITGADSQDVSDSGISDTASIDKDVTAVVNISFAVE